MSLFSPTSFLPLFSGSVNYSGKSGKPWQQINLQFWPLKKTGVLTCVRHFLSWKSLTQNIVDPQYGTFSKTELNLPLKIVGRDKKCYFSERKSSYRVSFISNYITHITFKLQVILSQGFVEPTSKFALTNLTVVSFIVLRRSSVICMTTAKS